MSGNALEQAEIVNLCSFLVMTSCDDVTIKNEKYICTLLLNSFHLRYHSTISGQKRKSFWFSVHYDVTIWIFLESVTSSKDSPYFKEGPCQVLSKSLEPFFRGSNPPYFGHKFCKSPVQKTNTGIYGNSAKEICVITHFFSLTFKKWVKTKISYIACTQVN